MVNYSDLHKEIIRKIALEHLENHEDFEAFRGVCSSWRTETVDVKYLCPSKNIQLPWLMLADSPTSSHRRFYSLSKQMFRKIDFPKFDEDADDHRRYLSSKGWLISVTMKRALIHCFDVFSTRLIKLPSIPILSLADGDLWDDHNYGYQFSNFYFSSRPSSCSCDELEVAMVYDTANRIAFWRPGQQEWVKPMDEPLLLIEDVCFFRGEFYSIDHHLRVRAYGSGDTPKQSRIVADLNSQQVLVERGIKFYIVVLDNSKLLVIHRAVTVSPEREVINMYWTRLFELFEVNVDDGKVRQVEGIGDDRALFVGFNSTFFVEACSSDKRSCRPNCIYFTDDNYENYHPIEEEEVIWGYFAWKKRKWFIDFTKVLLNSVMKHHQYGCNSRIKDCTLVHLENEKLLQLMKCDPLIIDCQLDRPKWQV